MIIENIDIKLVISTSVKYDLPLNLMKGKKKKQNNYEYFLLKTSSV